MKTSTDTLKALIAYVEKTRAEVVEDDTLPRKERLLVIERLMSALTTDEVKAARLRDVDGLSVQLDQHFEDLHWRWQEIDQGRPVKRLPRGHLREMLGGLR